MRDSHSDLAGFAQLHRLSNADEVRPLWRRGMASLAALAAEHQPVPLEGFRPAALLSGVRIAMQQGLIDDLGWLSAPAAAVALYELASALPPSEEKRALGRRVLQTLHQSGPETFVALAAALALGSSRVLRGTHVRARVALSLDAPTGLGLRPGPLALALISRRDSVQEWVGVPSTGSLPSRRLAARLLERAAREAARRAASGDETGVRMFLLPAIQAALKTLLADRESLVWRHAASARGLLSAAIPSWASDIENGLAPSFTPTEWRRAAASLAARIAIDPDGTVSRCRRLLSSEIAARDRGIAAAMIAGLPCAADGDLTAADTLLDALVNPGDLLAVEALADLRRERVDGALGARTAERVRIAYAAAPATTDPGRTLLREALMRELTPRDQRQEHTTQDHLHIALAAFASGGRAATAADGAAESAAGSSATIEAAAAATNAALDAAHGAMARLQRSGNSDSPAKPYREAFMALRELDRGLLETGSLANLIVLYAPSEKRTADALLGRLARWLLSRETSVLTPSDVEAVSRHFTWRLRRLRGLLHLVDAERVDSERAHSQGEGQREDGDEWRLRAMNVLLARVSQDVPSPLRRATCAALARACDAAVRAELCELSDVLVAVTVTIRSERDLTVISEASMASALDAAVRAYVSAMRQVVTARQDPSTALSTGIEALNDLVASIPAAISPRVESLRGAILHIARALGELKAARALQDIASGGLGDALSSLASATAWLGRLIAGALRRLGYRGDRARTGLQAALRDLDSELGHAVRGDRTGLESAVHGVIQAMRAELLPLIAEVGALVLNHLTSLPLQPEEADDDAAEDEPHGGGIEAPPVMPLTPWLPPDRILGGYHILRTIDRGAVGSVFVACRVEERMREHPPVFALKVPEYGGDAAHTLSEAEFMQLFRDEAQALLALPHHANLARFITFDAGAKPKPILVMELVPGPTLERVLEREALSVADLLAVIDGVAAGLGAMHEVGIAHLDVKPANIILRDHTATEVAADDMGGHVTPVLVDFGLAGRRLRPGCATVYYGAPEVWAAKPRLDISPTHTDVYAFVCMVFEMLTGELLFDGDTAVAIMSHHLEHDGLPPRLRAYRRRGHLRALMDCLAQGLRPEPEARADIVALRKGLAALTPELSRLPWPLT